jgi:hypothetical protein
VPNPFKLYTDPLSPRHPDAPDPSYQGWLHTEEARHGHPTAPGFRDSKGVRPGDPTTTLDGVPGVPRLRMRPESSTFGIPGQTPAGPIQRNVNYNDVQNP